VLIEATSLGGVESSPASRSTRRFNMTPQERLDAGILPGMLRLSIALEREQPLFDDLCRALRATA
jgi:cystathionine beta-lyase/cystathionine gamma-synthase